jgi:hypothetical protein
MDWDGAIKAVLGLTGAAVNPMAHCAAVKATAVVRIVEVFIFARLCFYFGYKARLGRKSDSIVSRKEKIESELLRGRTLRTHSGGR